MISITVTDECNPKATFLLLNAWDPFRSYVNQRVPSDSYVIMLGKHSFSNPIMEKMC